MTHDPLRNPKDPLLKTGPEVEKDILRQFAQLADGFPRHEVINAAWNLIITTIRQDAETRLRAERLFDEYSGRMKHILLEQHYDNAGKRRNIYPFTQNLDMPLVELNTEFFKT